MRKATFAVTAAKSNSSDHNSRVEAPQYLIGLAPDTKNDYKLFYTDENFTELAQAKYKKVVGQNMQKKQVETLVKETVLSLEKHHKIEDVINLFSKLNKKYGGHFLTEVALHRDEGHFEKDGIDYRINEHIFLKEDGYFIVPDVKYLDDGFVAKKEDATEKVNINDFEKIYNYHAHCKFSKYDLNVGKTARMAKGDIGKRLKFVAEDLKLKYEPDSKKRNRMPVAELKKQYDLVRREKIKARENTKVLNSEISEHKKVLDALQPIHKELKEIKQVPNNAVQFVEFLSKEIYNYKDVKLKITALEDLTNSQKRELHLLNNKINRSESTVEELQIITKKLKTEVSELKAEKKELIEELQATKKSLEVQNLSQNAKNDAESKLDSLNTENESLKTKVSELRAENTTLKLENSTLKRFLSCIAEDLGCENTFESIGAAFDKVIEQSKKYVSKVKDLFKEQKEIVPVTLEDIQKADRASEKQKENSNSHQRLR